MSKEKRLKGSTQRTAQLTISNTLVNLTDSAGTTVAKPAEIRSYQLYNPNDFDVWLKIYNGAASSFTLSSATPNEVYQLNPGLNDRPVREVTYMSTRMCYAVTRESGAGATSPVQAVVGKLYYGLG
jgi:hypothetical protein